MPTNQNAHDEDAGKGAVEQDKPSDKTNVSRTGQNSPRDPSLNADSSDFPEPGQNEEHTGEPQTKNELDRDTDANPQDVTEGDTPGSRQKENQNKSKDDPLAA